MAGGGGYPSLRDSAPALPRSGLEAEADASGPSSSSSWSCGKSSSCAGRPVLRVCRERERVSEREGFGASAGRPGVRA